MAQVDGMTACNAADNLYKASHLGPSKTVARDGGVHGMKAWRLRQVGCPMLAGHETKVSSTLSLTSGLDMPLPEHGCSYRHSIARSASVRQSKSSGTHRLSSRHLGALS